MTQSIHYEVQTRFIYGWENCWWDHEADPYAPVKSTYDTMEEARAEIRDAIKNDLREPDDRFTEYDFRIIKVTTNVVVDSDELQLHLG
jgi:hypothetical protein